MTETELRDMICSGENISLLSRFFANHSDDLDLLIKIGLDDSEQYTWRAIWMADKIHEQKPELIFPYFPAFLDFLRKTQNSGKKRHLLKLISLHPAPRSEMAWLLNYCTDVFTSLAEPVAVRVHAMQILFNIAQAEPDFSGELIELIEHELEFHGSAGMSSRGKKLLKKLHVLNRRY